MAEPNRNVYHFLVCVNLGSHGGESRFKPCGKNMYHMPCNLKTLQFARWMLACSKLSTKRHGVNVQQDANLKENHYEYLKSRKSRKIQIFSDVTPCLLVNLRTFRKIVVEETWDTQYLFPLLHKNKTPQQDNSLLQYYTRSTCFGISRPF